MVWTPQGPSPSVDERRFTNWARMAASTIAVALRDLDPSQREKTLNAYRSYRDQPPSMFTSIGEGAQRRLEDLVGGERLRGVVLVALEPLAITPTLQPLDSFDFVTALNRRFYVGGVWFSILALNGQYLKDASDSILRYILLHELVQGEIYRGMAERGVKAVSLGERDSVHLKAQRETLEQLRLTDRNLTEERGLLRAIFPLKPAVPALFVTAALYLYLENNLRDLKECGAPSVHQYERDLEQYFATEFPQTLDLQRRVYAEFVNSLEKNLGFPGPHT